jgi:putative heme-binding domain-containing protein
VNEEILERKGSGYLGRHGGEPFIFDDPWFRGLELASGPDGGVFVLDWNDTGECHETTGVYRTSGRVYKITYGTPRIFTADVAKLSIDELIGLQSNRNEWFVRQGRRQLAEFAHRGAAFDRARSQLRELLAQGTNSVVQLRALWALYGMGEADESLLRKQLGHQNEHMRAWAVRLLSDSWPLDTVMSRRPAGRTNLPPAETLGAFTTLAKSEPSGLVRLTLASVLQRLPISARAELAAPLMAHPEDADDHNLPLLTWYGLIPLGDEAPATLATLAADCAWPVTRQCIARRLSEDIDKNPAPLNALLTMALERSDAFQADVLSGISEGLRGWRKAPKPAAWDAFQQKLANNSASQQRVRDLSALFGDGRALDEVKRVALDKKASLASRRTALQTLIEQRPPGLRDICESLLEVKILNSTAVRGLALFNDPAIGQKLAGSYHQFVSSERGAVMETLVSQPAFATALLDQIAAGRIPRADLTPFQARQIRSFNDPALTKRLGEVWGQLRDSPQEKRILIAQLKARLTPEEFAHADQSAGRVVFSKTCASCHTLFGHGGDVGPDLTGSGRDNLDYLLENVVDPSAVVNAAYQMSIVEMNDHRTLTGLISARTDHTVTLKTATETLTLPRAEIRSIRQSSLSMMPEGLLEGFNETQLRDLIAYLMSPTQVP